MAMSRIDIMDQLAKKADSLGYQWVGCDWSGAQTNVTLRIYIDHVDGVNIDQCASVSRELSTLLDVLDAIPYRYVLQVSSPGVQRPLFTAEHFSEQLGKQVKIKLVNADDLGRRQFQGQIDSVDEGVISLTSIDGESIIIEHADIAKAVLAVDVTR